MKSWQRLRISFFGAPLPSGQGNGNAAYHQGILGALARRGHQVVFHECPTDDRQAAVASAADRDLLIMASEAGAVDPPLERALLDLRSERCRVVFWDGDPSTTVARFHTKADPLRALAPLYDAVFTHGGGHPVVAAYQERGARRVVPIYDALDPTRHHPVAKDPRLVGDLGLLADRTSAREGRVDELFLGVAARLPHRTFVLGGSGWESKVMPPNVRHVGPVAPAQHNAFHCSTRVVLNVPERPGKGDHAPGAPLFAAAGAGACVISDRFLGAERFLRPATEILLADDGADVARLLESLSPAACRRIGNSALRRVLDQHTYQHRADTCEAVLRSLWPAQLPAHEALGVGPPLAALYSSAEAREPREADQLA